MTKDEALKLALDALENTDRSKLFELEKTAITAIREVLVQPVQPALQPLTDEQWFQSELFKLAVNKGLLSIHTELVAAPQTDPITKLSWMEGHNKACDISNESALNTGDQS